MTSECYFLVLIIESKSTSVVSGVDMSATCSKELPSFIFSSTYGQVLLKLSENSIDSHIAIFVSVVRKVDA